MAVPEEVYREILRTFTGRSKMKYFADYEKGVTSQAHYERLQRLLELYYKLGEAESLDALCYELDLLSIEYQRQIELDVHYKNIKFERRFRADLLVEKKILVENKAIKKITNQDEAQLINYLKPKLSDFLRRYVLRS